MCASMILRLWWPLDPLHAMCFVLLDVAGTQTGHIHWLPGSGPVARVSNSIDLDPCTNVPIATAT